MAAICNFRRRHSARILAVSPLYRVLLFRFIYKDGLLAGNDYWATPGGGLESGESYEEAAIREFREETGINVGSVGLSVADKEFLWRMPSGEIVIAVEKYFVVDVETEVISLNELTSNEVQATFEYRWWSEFDLKETKAVIWPSDLFNILKITGRF